MEQGSNTPDFILATYLMQCLNAFNDATCSRMRWRNGVAENTTVDLDELIPNDHSELY